MSLIDAEMSRLKGEIRVLTRERNAARQAVETGLETEDALRAENDRLRHLLMGAASTSHTAEKHPPYGSSFLDCTWSTCTTYRVALAAERRPAPADQEAGSE